jgi:glycosyltransferase involved in cell wall biosynthesis
MPKVSVITPVYNGQSYIGVAINSVLAQTLTDWELIVINDGSTDETAEILWQFSDRRIKVIHQSNAGEAAARNSGLVAATGELIAFLDADDLYLRNALQDMVACLDERPDIGAVYSEGYFCDEQQQILVPLSENRPGIITGNILEQLVLDPAVITATISTMIRREIIEQFQIRFDPAFVIGPDWEFLIQVAHRANFGYVETPTCLYRIHQANITVKVDEEKRKMDLASIRRKLMEEHWFDALSLDGRHIFFQALLVDDLSGNWERQQAVMSHRTFFDLGASRQVRLLRAMAIDYLLAHGDAAKSRLLLRNAIGLNPISVRNHLLLVLSRLPVVAGKLVEVWRQLHRSSRDDDRNRLRRRLWGVTG